MLVGDSDAGLESETTERAVLGRFQDLGLLGEGAMGEVRRVLDPELHRPMAMKILKPGLSASPGAWRRFVDEAQATAQLQHPGIVPVHELGTLPDGRIYFTMREIRGRTLGDVIHAVHLAGGRSAGGWTQRRLIDAFRAACDAVAYAHHRGVVHRDIKPDNIMVGHHGEVLVVDWGLAKVLGDLTPDEPHVADDSPIATTRSRAGYRTQPGLIAGTPAYMPPEQARGHVHLIDARADVYALGAILFVILYGAHPYTEAAGDVLKAVCQGPPELPVGSTLPVPGELEAIRARAMSREREDRYADAAALAADVLTWLDGVRKREIALELVEQSRALGPRAATLRRHAQVLRDRAATALKAVATWSAERDKVDAWAEEAEAERLEARADLLDVEAEEHLQRALAHDPDLPEAHEALAERYLAEVEAAEATRRPREARRARALLEAHVNRLPAASPARARLEAWLRGEGTLTLHTLPPWAKATLFVFAPDPKRLVPRRVRDLGFTPLEAVSLPIGSYAVELVLGDGPPVRVPFVVERLAHVQPTAEPLRLPRPGDLGHHDVLVAGGPYWSGGDGAAVGSGPRRQVHVDSFVMRRHPVTNAEYIAFLDDLVARGRANEALRHAPRERGGTIGEAGAVIYGRDEHGRFVLRADADGDLWLPDWPVLMVDWQAAAAFAAWEAERSGLPWRLPTAAEVEKAARGVDGRFYPWGDAFDPSWCCMRDSHPGRPEPAVVSAFPHDVSPYGVRGLAGNARCWCGDGPSTGRRYDRGGFWLGNARECRAADVHDHEETHRAAEIGIRLVRSW